MLYFASSYGEPKREEFSSGLIKLHTLLRSVCCAAGFGDLLRFDWMINSRMCLVESTLEINIPFLFYSKSTLEQNSLNGSSAITSD